MDQPELRAWRIDDVEGHLSFGAGDLTQQNSGGSLAECVSALAPSQGERVAYNCRASSCAEGRLQNEGLLDVAAADVGGSGGTDGPVAGILVEEPGEDRRAVEAGKAQPVHRALGGDQGGRAAVGQQGMVTDRSRAHRPQPVCPGLGQDGLSRRHRDRPTSRAGR